MSKVIGLLLIMCGLVLAVYGGLTMLYGGIMAAVNNWGVNDEAVVWGIIRARFCGIGAIPGMTLFYLGLFTTYYSFRRSF